MNFLATRLCLLLWMATPSCCLLVTPALRPQQAFPQLQRVLVSPCAAESAEAPSKVPRTIDLRRKRSTKAKVKVSADDYGTDPRLKHPILEDPDFMKVEPTQATVQRLRTVKQLDDAVREADAEGRVAIIKFFSKTCRACLAAKPKFNALAQSTDSAKASFYEVEYETAKNFVQKCEVRFMPTGQIYSKGELVLASSIASASFPKFCEKLDETLSASEAPSAPNAADEAESQ